LLSITVESTGEAVLAGDLELVKRLVESDPSIVNVTSCCEDLGGLVSPLHDAASEGHVEVMEFLLDRGAFTDTGLLATSEEKRRKDGATPLGFACQHGQPNAAEVLLSRGAKSLTPTSGYAGNSVWELQNETPLVRATVTGKTERVRRLLLVTGSGQRLTTPLTPLERQSFPALVQKGTPSWSGRYLRQGQILPQPRTERGNRWLSLRLHPTTTVTL